MKKNDCLIQAHKPIAANLRRFTGPVSALLNRGLYLNKLKTLSSLFLSLSIHLSIYLPHMKRAIFKFLVLKSKDGISCVTLCIDTKADLYFFCRVCVHVHHSHTPQPHNRLQRGLAIFVRICGTRSKSSTNKFEGRKERTAHHRRTPHGDLDEENSYKSC
jgi:hypothetical protein